MISTTALVIAFWTDTCIHLSSFDETDFRRATASQKLRQQSALIAATTFAALRLHPNNHDCDARRLQPALPVRHAQSTHKPSHKTLVDVPICLRSNKTHQKHRVFGARAAHRGNARLMTGSWMSCGPAKWRTVQVARCLLRASTDTEQAVAASSPRAF